MTGSAQCDTGTKPHLSGLDPPGCATLSAALCVPGGGVQRVACAVDLALAFHSVMLFCFPESNVSLFLSFTFSLGPFSFYVVLEYWSFILILNSLSFL